jgi:hypothetical protein
VSAADAAVAVARAHGLRVEEPVVIRDRLNMLVHLRPTPVVARVAGSIAAVRQGDEWLQRELAVAASLAAAGAPVVAPSPELPPGPHHHDGRILSFWTYVPESGAASPRAAGEALRDVHEALKDFHGALPVLGHLTEAEALLARRSTSIRASSRCGSTPASCRARSGAPTPLASTGATTARGSRRQGAATGGDRRGALCVAGDEPRQRRARPPPRLPEPPRRARGWRGRRS